MCVLKLLLNNHSIKCSKTLLKYGTDGVKVNRQTKIIVDNISVQNVFNQVTLVTPTALVTTDDGAINISYQLEILLFFII